MKGILNKLLVLCVLFSQPLTVCAAESTAKKPYIDVAAILDLSGGTADQGQWSRRGVELAVEELRAADKVDLNIIYEDTRAEPRLAVDAYKSLYARKPFVAMLTFGSDVGIALSPLSNQDRVVQIGVATGTPKYASKNDFNFRTYPSAAEEGRFLAKEIPNQLNGSEIGLLSIQNEYAEGVAQVFRKQISGDKTEIVVDETFRPGETDFRSILVKLKNYPQALLLVIAHPNEGALLIKQARQLDLSNMIIATAAIVGASSFFKTIGAAGEGIFIAFPFEDPTTTRNDTMRDFYHRYVKRYQSDIGIEYVYSAVAYDAVMLIAKGIESCPSGDSDCLRSQLQNTAQLPGATRVLTFDENGDAPAKYHFAVVQKGSFQRLYRK